MREILRLSCIVALLLAVGVILVPADALAFEPLFDARIDYVAGDTPRSVFSIDLDGDGDDDLAVANYSSNNVSILLNRSDILTAVEDDDPPELPLNFRLSQNYPNPFNPTTQIEYSLPARGHVKIEVFNILGQQVRILIDREQPAGAHRVLWDGKDASGKRASTGPVPLPTQGRRARSDEEDAVVEIGYGEPNT